MQAPACRSSSLNKINKKKYDKGQLHTEHLGFLALSKRLTNQFAIQTDATTALGEPEQTHKTHNMAASNNRDHTHDHSITCSHHLYMGVSSPTSHLR